MAQRREPSGRDPRSSDMSGACTARVPDLACGPRLHAIPFSQAGYIQWNPQLGLPIVGNVRLCTPPVFQGIVFF